MAQVNKMRAALIVLGCFTVALFAVPQIRWRLQVVWLQLTGEIKDIDLEDLVAYSLPGSEQSMAFLIEKRSPYAVIRNFRTSDEDVDAGTTLFRERCATCHAPDAGGGPLGPSLVARQYKHGDSDWAVYRSIRYGVPNTTMLPTPDLTESQRWQLLAAIRFLDGSVDTSGENVDAALTADVDVPFAELARQLEPASDWLTYSGSYAGTRHSALRDVDRTNVGSLGLRWAHQFENGPKVEASPLVRNGVMFVPTPPCSVRALNAATGRALWTWNCTLMGDLQSATTIWYRGVALLDDKVFFASYDARLFALDAETGAQLWVATVEPEWTNYYVTSAPFAFRDLVVSGVSSRSGGRGSVTAFNVKTGKEQWRFHTVPAEGEEGNETWAGDSWRNGGGTTWVSGSYDPTSDLLYWGVGNPKPDYDKTVREGDNLFTNSVIALRGATGELVWHFQFVPADNRDWGANQVPVLVDRSNDGTNEKLLLWANRNGFFYVLDRISGTFLLGKPFVRQTWTQGLDRNGRPLPPPEGTVIEGQLTYPGNVGGTHWYPPTYYPPRDLMIVPVLEQGMVFFSSSRSPPQEGGRAFYTAVRAINATTGDLVWEYRRPPRVVDNFMPGLVSTAGGLVFGSDQTTFFALDAETGELLWSVETGGGVISAPIVYSVDQTEFISIAAGGDLLTFALPLTEQADDVTAASTAP